MSSALPASVNVGQPSLFPEVRSVGLRCEKERKIIFWKIKPFDIISLAIRTLKLNKKYIY